jgi:hypothetical protein
MSTGRSYKAFQDRSHGVKAVAAETVRYLQKYEQ